MRRVERLGAAREGGRACVVIPLYRPDLSPAEVFSVERTLEVLAGYPVVAICPSHLARAASKIIGAARRPGVVAFEAADFASVGAYNALLMSRRFYRAFAGFEFILVVQTDALVLSDELEGWCARGYSYVGAPWFEGFVTPTEPLKLLGVGNGGFSLRKVADFRRVLARPRYVPNTLTLVPGRWRDAEAWREFLKDRFKFAYNVPGLLPRVNEDAFWGVLVPRRVSFFTVPTPEQAIAFAFEAAPAYLYHLNGDRLPFGCHAWERYDRAFWARVLGERGVALP